MERDDEVKGEGNSYTTHFRQYDPRVARWLSVDPLSDNFPWQSSFVSMDNNPILLYDPTGAAPVYDEDGNFLGTDDAGFQDMDGNQNKSIIMNAENFEQGMSHEDALQFVLGMAGLKSDEAKEKHNEHYKGIVKRPDYDGVVTPDEGVKWAKEHPNLKKGPDDLEFLNASPDDYLYLDASKMDFGNVTVNDFDKIGKSQIIHLLDKKSLSPRNISTVYALGRTRMTLLDKEGNVRVENGHWNAFDWDYDGSWYKTRNVLLFLERLRTSVNDNHGVPVSVYRTGKVPLNCAGIGTLGRECQK